jgi:hypothetical protein
LSSRVSRHAPLPNECLFTPIHSRLDPSIFVTYRPISKKYSKMLRARNYIFSQCITIHTIQSQAIDNLTTVNPIPDSEAALSCAPARSFGAWYSFAGLVPQHTKENKKPDIRVPLLMNLDGVENLGTDGKLNWVCSVPSQGKNTLTLQWELRICSAEFRWYGWTRRLK